MTAAHVAEVDAAVQLDTGEDEEEAGVQFDGAVAGDAAGLGTLHRDDLLAGSRPDGQDGSVGEPIPVRADRRKAEVGGSG
jgi:hypothetical protein